MTLSLLKIMGHRIAISDWDPLLKQSVWTAGVVSFFSSARMGELMARNSKTPVTDVLSWNNLKLSNESAFIYLGRTKTARDKGESLDIFAINGESFCPVSALYALLEVSKAQGNFRPNGPVFWASKRTVLDMVAMNKLLRTIFSDLCETEMDTITCHSFRAAIPTAVMKLGITNHDSTLKTWGRWSSNCYRTYAKLQTGQKRLIFNTILETLL